MNNTSVITTTSEVVKPSFGNGRYSKYAEQFFSDIQRIFRVEPSKAEKIARQLMSDIGAVMASEQAKITFGKLNNDGQLKIKELVNSRKIVATNPISLARAIQWTQEAYANGVSFKDTEFQLSETLQQYIDKL